MRRLLPLLGFALAVLSLQPLGLAEKKPKVDPTIRAVQGTVMDPADKPVSGAIVTLKNTKTLQMRSFIAKADGSYAFYGLSTNVDYELQAAYQGAVSGVKTLSVFDSRSKATINLKLSKK
jgi:Carboxypeptidase regulatory-like domain